MSKDLKALPCWVEARGFAGPSFVGIAVEIITTSGPDLSVQRPAPDSQCFVAILGDLALFLKRERLPNLMRLG